MEQTKNHVLIHKDELAGLYNENKRLREGNKRMAEVIRAALEYFRILGHYRPEEQGAARVSIEGKLQAALQIKED